MWSRISTVFGFCKVFRNWSASYCVSVLIKVSYAQYIVIYEVLVFINKQEK